MKRRCLSDLAAPGGLVGGPFGSDLVSSDYTASGIPVIRGANMSHGRELGGDYVYVSEAKFERRLSRNSAIKGDLVFTQRGTLGQVAIVPDGVFVVSQSQMRLRPDTAQANPLFLYYACTHSEFLVQVDVHAIRTGVPHINLGILGQMEVPLPDLATQTAIADVLGALDDKIAANERANSIASSFSQSLLVRASDLVPLVPLGQLVDVPRKTVTPVPGGVWHFSLPAFDDGEVPKMEDGAEIKSAKQRLDQPAVLLSKLNPRIPRVWDVATIPEVHPALASTEFIVLEPRSASTGELTAALRLPASLDGLQSLARGTSGSHQRVSPADAMALEIPDVTQLPAALRRTLTVLAAATASRRTEAARLAATRDALLPELMSGRLTVSSVLEDVWR